MIPRDFIYIAYVRMPTEKAHGLQIMKTCEALARREPGMRVTLAVPKRATIHADDPFSFYGLEKRNNFTIDYMPSLDLLRFGFLKKIAFFAASRLFARRAFKKYSSQSAIFYTRDAEVADVFGSRGKEIFFEIHSIPDKEKKKKQFFKILERCKGWIAISEGICEDLREEKIRNPEFQFRKWNVVPDAAEFNDIPSQGECRRKLEIPLDAFVILYAGHLYPWKGAHLVAETAARIDALFYIVGGTINEVNQFRKNYQSPNLRIVGWRNPKEIPCWLRAANFAVVPTSGKTRIGEKYTSPLKLQEAMAVGTPIIAANLPSIREIVTAEEVLFFNADSVSDLERVIGEGMKNYEIWKRRAGALRRKVTTWDIRAMQILTLISH